MESSQDPNAALAAMGPMLGVIGIFYVVLLVAMVVAWISIIKKAGYSGWFVLLGIVPLVNLIFFFIFAFNKWPVQKKAEGLPA